MTVDLEVRYTDAIEEPGANPTYLHVFQGLATVKGGKPSYNYQWTFPDGAVEPFVNVGGIDLQGASFYIRTNSPYWLNSTLSGVIGWGALSVRVIDSSSPACTASDSTGVATRTAPKNGTNTQCERNGGCPI